MLPAWVNADGSIVIDFSAPPKGGPKDFHGTWDNDGIKFTKDGNKWPQVARTRRENLNYLLEHLDEYDPAMEEVSQDDFYNLHKEVA